MLTEMDDTEIQTLGQVKKFLNASQGVNFKGSLRPEKYHWLEEIVDRFKYFDLNRKSKGKLREYMMSMTDYSQAQLTRLLAQKLLNGAMKTSWSGYNSFKNKYTKSDIELLAQTDNLHGRLSGPATRKIFNRQYCVYGDNAFIRLQKISSSHIYNLRESHVYLTKTITIGRTISVQIAIGVRRKPNPGGAPGYLRVDSVHQGEFNGIKGVYQINLVDEVTQWEIVICVPCISEMYLKEALALALEQFPFIILNFHSDNGGEFINKTVAALLNTTLIKQSKSRSCRTNDNALVEGKNASVVRKHMGFWHIGQTYAPDVNRFYVGHFNNYLNYHRPCGFATVTIDEKGRKHKKYNIYHTPYEHLKSLENAPQYLKKGVSFKELDKIAMCDSDNESARRMQAAKDELFRKVLRPKGTKTLKKGDMSAELRRSHDETFHAHV